MLLISPLVAPGLAENTPIEKPASPVVYTLQVEGTVTAGNSAHINRVIKQAQGKADLDRNLLFPDQYSTKLKTMVRHA